MFSVLTRAFSFTLIIIAGIVMRSKGFLPESAGAAIKKLVINVTLPCAIITNFSLVTDLSLNMIFIAILAIIMNIIMIGVGALITRNKSKEQQALNMICLPAFNIGAFCLPFVQSFLPALGSVTACIFDSGNSIMCTGGTYAFVAEYTSHGGKGMDFKSFAKRLVSSPPLMCYVVMLVISALGLSLPDVIFNLIEPAAKANTFMSMLMLGLLFRLELKKDYITEIVKLLGLRLIFAIVCAVLFYNFAPYDLIIRQAFVIICFAPMSAVAPAYTGMCGGDEGMASCANSLSLVCSLVIITVLLAVMGLY